MMAREVIRVMIGLVIPYAAVLLSIPLVDHVKQPVFGMPFVIPCALGLFVLTSLCLGACWVLFDRNRSAG